MVLFLALLDTQEEQEKFREIYENYRHFMWYGWLVKRSQSG